jgi:group I intron endonuclease
MNNSGIYCITHVLSGRKYIGQSPRLVARLQDHISYLNRGKHKNPKLQAYWTKYGSSEFKFQILEVGLTKEELDIRERWYFEHIIDWDFDFNICRRSCSQVGRIPWNKGQAMLPHVRAAMTAAVKGRPSWNKGVPCKKETKEKLSNIIKNQYQNGRSPWNKGLKKCV